MTHNGNRTTLETLIPENAVTNGLFAIIAITCCLATAVTTQYTYFSSSQTFCNLWLGTTFEINNFFTSCNIKYCLWDKKNKLACLDMSLWITTLTFFSHIWRGLLPILYKIDKNPLWNVFLNIFDYLKWTRRVYACPRVLKVLLTSSAFVLVSSSSAAADSSSLVLKTTIRRNTATIRWNTF